MARLLGETRQMRGETGPARLISSRILLDRYREKIDSGIVLCARAAIGNFG